MTTASNPRSGCLSSSSSCAAAGRRFQGMDRDWPTSKNSATIWPCCAIKASARPRCQFREASGSCWSSVETLPAKANLIIAVGPPGRDRYRGRALDRCGVCVCWMDRGRGRISELRRTRSRVGGRAPESAGGAPRLRVGSARAGRRVPRPLCGPAPAHRIYQRNRGTQSTPRYPSNPKSRRRPVQRWYRSTGTEGPQLWSRFSSAVASNDAMVDVPSPA